VIPHLLTIAGSDSGGGAGVQADLKTFLAHGAFGMSAIAAITAQSPRRVTRVDSVPVEGLIAQIRTVFDDLPVHAVKIGMLGTAAHVEAVARVLGDLPSRPPIVLDPVMVSSSGARLLDPAAEHAMREALLPLASLVTPNLPEAAVLAQGPVDAWAARAPVPVLVTGGDTDADEVIDVLWRAGEPQTWRAPRVPGPSRHGTGCTLSSAIAARLARGATLPEAVEGAIRWVQALIAASPGDQLLHGLVAQPTEAS
jgi:hydroxymethylpyrimidine/phosphomethylpyrimidine kinase